MRILAVDDDPLILSILDATLSASGYGNITFANSAEQALEMIEEAALPFDILLLDVILPGISGIELCARIRTFTAYRATPIIMITASRAHDIMERAFRAGATDFVSKPFDGLELGTRINLAAMLSESIQRERQARHEMRDLTNLTAVSFDEPLFVAAGPHAHDLAGFENDLLRMPDGLFAMTLFAIQIKDARMLFDAETPLRFRRMIKAVGQVVGSVVPEETVRFAYAGAGQFVAVAHGRRLPDLHKLQAQIADKTQDRNASRNFGNTRLPMATIAKISEQKLWTGRSAAAAVMAFSTGSLNDTELPVR